MQKLRNCSGQFPDAKNFVNNHIHTRCPRAIFLEEREYREMVEIYFDCRNQKVYPYPGSVVQQTPFTRDLFEHLDSIVDEHVERRKAEIERERKKAAQRKK